MSFENLDAQDKAICDAIVAGATDESIVSDFGVDSDKIAQLRGHIANNPEAAGDTANGSSDESANTTPENGADTTGDTANTTVGAEGEVAGETAGESTEGAEVTPPAPEGEGDDIGA